MPHTQTVDATATQIHEIVVELIRCFPEAHRHLQERHRRRFGEVSEQLRAAVNSVDPRGMNDRDYLGLLGDVRFAINTLDAHIRWSDECATELGPTRDDLKRDVEALASGLPPDVSARPSVSELARLAGMKTLTILNCRHQDRDLESPSPETSDVVR